MSKRDDWCWSLDGETYLPAASRDAAVRELVQHCECKSSGDETFVGRVGQTQWASHEQMVESAFDDDIVVMSLEDAAYDDGGDHRDNYPDMNRETRDELGKLVRSTILKFLDERVEAPRWFTAVDEKEVEVYVDKDGKGRVVE